MRDKLEDYSDYMRPRASVIRIVPQAKNALFSSGKLCGHRDAIRAPDEVVADKITDISHKLMTDAEIARFAGEERSNDAGWRS